MKTKTKKIIKINAVIATTLTLFGASKYLPKLISDMHGTPKRLEEISHLLTKSKFGKPLYLPLNDTPIGIVISNFDEVEKEAIKNSIERLDNISENLKYKILDNDDARIEQKIVIKKCNYTNSSAELGQANYTASNYTSKISYPITINIDTEYVRWTNQRDKLLSHIIKHEMMHTLGFEDLYNEDYCGKSIMYFTVDDELKDYSSFDEQNIRTLCGDNIVVEEPSKVQTVSYLNIKKEEELEMI